jgi:steroid delta-isomerase-like uncharacterized protein
MDAVVNAHFAAEEAHDMDRLLATLNDDCDHDVVGFEPHRGHQEIRRFYEKVWELLQQEEVEPLRRYYGENFLVDEVVYTGQADGALFGVEGRRGRVSFRMLHVVELRDGRMSRENVWMDLDAARQQLFSSDG